MMSSQENVLIYKSTVDRNCQRCPGFLKVALTLDNTDKSPYICHILFQIYFNLDCQILFNIYCRHQQHYLEIPTCCVHIFVTFSSNIYDLIYLIKFDVFKKFNCRHQQHHLWCLELCTCCGRDRVQAPGINLF